MLLWKRLSDRWLPFGQSIPPSYLIYSVIELRRLGMSAQYTMAGSLDMIHCLLPKRVVMLTASPDQTLNRPHRV